MKKVDVDKNASNPMINNIGNNPLSMMMNAMGNNMMSNMEDNIIDSDAIEVVTEPTPIPPAVVSEDDENNTELSITDTEAAIEETNTLFIKNATPYNIHRVVADNKDIATLVFLCRDSNDKLFTISRNYILDTKEEVEFVKSLPFYFDDEEAFLSQKICNTSIIRYLDNYVIDMKFETDKGFENCPNPTITTVGLNSSDRSTKTLEMSSELYSAINFIDSYILSSNPNNHDLTLATVLASSNDKITPFFKVDSIDTIVAIAPAIVKDDNFFKRILDNFTKKEESTTIGLVIKVTGKFNDETESLYILTPFDIGVSFDENKFKGSSIEKLQDTYYGDSDQYVSTLLVDDTIITYHNIYNDNFDKRYMTIRGKNKDKNTKIFLFDYALKEELIKMINEY